MAPRTKKRIPYDPSKQIHDRRAVESNRGVKKYLVPIEVDDPFEPGAKITVMRSTRNDPLADLHARRSIDDAQYEGGRAFQEDFQTAERGPGAVDPGNEYVDGGLMPEPISESQRRATKRLVKVYRALGQDGSAIVHDVLVYGLTMARVGVRRGLTGERWEKYFGMRFRECLNCLAEVYGFAMKSGL